MNSICRSNDLNPGAKMFTSRMSVFSAVLYLAITLIYCQSAFAQDSTSTMKAAKYKDVTWYNVNQIKFKPGKMGDAMKIVRKYFIPASEVAGTRAVMVLENKTGKWDVTVIFKMNEGPSGMEWRLSPENVVFYEQVQKLAGGKEKAKKIWGEYLSCIATSSRTIALQENALVGKGN